MPPPFALRKLKLKKNLGKREVSDALEVDFVLYIYLFTRYFTKRKTSNISLKLIKRHEHHK